MGWHGREGKGRALYCVGNADGDGDEDVRR
jgi:hypothetical protein